MQIIGKAASSACGSGGGSKVGRELLRRLRLRPLTNDAAAAAAANGGERSASTLSFSSSISTGNGSLLQHPGLGATLSAHDMPLSAAATGTSAYASAFVLQQPLRHYSTSSPSLGSRGRGARRGGEKRTRRRRKKSGGGSGGSSGSGGSRRGGNKPLLWGGRGRRGGGGGSGGGGGGNRLDLLPLPSADGGSGGSYDAFGAFSSAKDEYEALYGDTGDEYDDFDGEKRLYYYQTPDEANEANGVGIGDVPPTIRSKMESDPTYFHGMEALALQWTTPSTDPPSRDVQVQAVLRDIIHRQKLSAAAKKKKGQGVADSGWNGKVVVRIPKHEDGIEDHNDVGINSTDDEEIEDPDGVGSSDDEDDDDDEEAEDQHDDTNDEDLVADPTSGVLEDDEHDVEENVETDGTEEENSGESSLTGVDKTKPRRTSYNVFTKLRTEQFRESDSDLSPRKVRDRVLSEWREMTDEEKLVWKAKAKDMGAS